MPRLGLDHHLRIPDACQNTSLQQNVVKREITLNSLSFAQSVAYIGDERISRGQNYFPIGDMYS
jgi:hypothetical protein